MEGLLEQELVLLTPQVPYFGGFLHLDIISTKHILWIEWKCHKRHCHWHFVKTH